ncbi:sensor histidine kinase [Nocardioides sp. GCM10027113]|uniref:sensor histidine kinase n=1 Tax=unclassified Nocardioides TaxID=2615069 RepID=UPI00360E2BE4
MGTRDARARSISAGRMLLLGDELHPGVPQTAFLALYVVDTALRSSGIAGLTGPAVWSGRGVGAVLVVALTAAAWLLPWRLLPPWAVGALPVLDLAAIGLVRLDQVGAASTALLAAVPAVWLGRHAGRGGAAVVGLTTFLLVGLPPVLLLGSDGELLARMVLLPVVAAWAALVVAVGLERAGMAFAEMERQREELGRAMVSADHHRRIAAAILDTVDVGLVLLDGDGAYQTMNRRHLDFMHLAYPDGHAGRAGQLGLVFGPDGTTRLTREEMPTWRASRGEEFDDCRIWVGEDPATRRALSVSARAVHDQAGAFAGAALAYKDVTDFMLALRSKDDFVAAVSHELRTPLTSVVGYVDLLREEGWTSDAPAQLDVVARNADRLARLVSDLLESAKLEQGPMPVSREPADLAVVVRERLAAVAPSVAAAGLELDVDVPDSLPASVDVRRMGQVVDNLLSNAVKYTPTGGRVTLTLTETAEGAELAVADTGIGISALDLEQLFTRFYRAREAERRAIQGIGLGLSIVRAIVDGHGGRIEVESEPGRGSVFRVVLPAPEQAPEHAPQLRLV